VHGPTNFFNERSSSVDKVQLGPKSNRLIDHPWLNNWLRAKLQSGASYGSTSHLLGVLRRQQSNKSRAVCCRSPDIASRKAVVKVAGRDGRVTESDRDLVEITHDVADPVQPLN
jgi:hypothetical protein